MQVHQLTAYVVRLPLRRPSGSLGQSRWYSDNLLIRCELRQPRRKPIVGWGEGVPAPWLTGETTEGALRQLEVTPLGEQLEGAPANWSEVIAMVDRFQPTMDGDDPRGCRSNALRSAVELALLDAYGQLFSEPVSNALLQIPEVAGLISPQPRVQYSAVISATRPQRLGATAFKTRLLGFRHCKVNVGTEPEIPRRLQLVREWLGPDIDLRIDAGGSWRADELLQRLGPLYSANLSCIEQPVAHEELEPLAELRGQIHLPVMLDESITSETDTRRAIELGACDLINIDISKCGGLVRSARLAALAHRHGLGFQLGCEMGETSLLAAAGRHFATMLSGVWYLEGSAERHHLRLRAPLTRHDLTYGFGGWAPRILRSGIGTEVLPRRLKRRLLATREFLVDRPEIATGM